MVTNGYESVSANAGLSYITNSVHTYTKPKSSAFPDCIDVWVSLLVDMIHMLLQNFRFYCTADGLLHQIVGGVQRQLSLLCRIRTF